MGMGKSGLSCKKQLSKRKIIQEPVGRQQIAVVGMMPGRDELAEGRPFVGYEGRYLRRLMKRAGINMDVLPVTNAAHERGAGDKWENLSNEAKKFGQEELIKDLKRWRDAGVNLVVALGAPALKATTGKDGILKYRGTCLPCVVDGLKVLPSIHPGYIIKGNQRYEPILTLDLRKAAREKHTPEIHYPFRDITIIDTAAEAIQIAQSCTNSSDPIVVDIETGHPHTQRMTAYGIATSKSQAFVFTREILRDPDVLRAIGHMASSSTLKIFHNALFDAFHGAYYYKICYNNIYCTLIAQHDCYPMWPKSLAFCASIWTNEPYWKDDSEVALSTPGKVDWDLYYRYCGKDCCLTYEIYECLEKEIDSWGVRQAVTLDMKNIRPVLFAMLRGIKIDTKVVDVYAAKNERAIEILERIKHATIGDINVKSHLQLKHLLYDQWALPTQRKKGKVTIEDKKLKYLETLPTPYRYLIGMIRTTRDRYKRREFYSWKLDPDRRVRTALKIHGTYTGRWASSKSITGSGRNMQNTPKSTRVFYVPDDGKIFIEMDLSQSEARIVAALSKDIKWLKEFDTVDQHTKVAALLFHISEQDVDHKTHRQIGKRVAHASHYHLGWRLLAEIVGCSAAEAKRLKKRYFEVRPSVLRWHKFIKTEIKKTRVIKTCFGRVMQFFGPFFDSLITDATAAEPQSTSASYLNDALARIYDNIPEFEFLLQVHDSILCQVPDDVETITRVIKQMRSLTEREICVRGVKFVIPAEFTIGYDWYNGVEIADITKVHAYRKEARKLFEEYRCSIANFSKTTESTQAGTKHQSSSTCG